jgi:hypothetical protein
MLAQQGLGSVFEIFHSARRKHGRDIKKHFELFAKTSRSFQKTFRCFPDQPCQRDTARPSQSESKPGPDVAARSITDVRVLFTPGRRFKQMLDTVQFHKENVN